MIRLGVDTGGTFTDLVRLDANGLSVHKVRSTPENPAQAILSGISELAGDNTLLELVHGSTVATNAVLEQKGARVALITTKGFEDVLRIGRQTRSELYNFLVPNKPSMVADDLIFGLSERVDQHGNILEALAHNELVSLQKRFVQAGVECVAICFLHSYANRAHEDYVANFLRESGFIVSTSSGVLPEYREYERWSTTVVNAYVTPLMSRYLTALESGIAGTPLRIMQSNGGSISAEQARATAVRTILSGPAAGVIGARAVALASGFERVLLFDMGGTSTDVSLIDGQLGTTSESTVGGFPVRLSVLDIHTVGAGGGSIAYVDTGGSLRVGPRSAGADPGPVCYGKGDELTVTDANLMLGRLDPDSFLGGRMDIDRDRTTQRIERFAKKLDLSPTRLAEGIVQIANANMERATRAVSVQRGYDPRDFALLAFGGAGGMHACEIADSMEIDTVLVPEHAGVLSALGMLLADMRKDYSQTVLIPSNSMSFDELDQLFVPLVAHAEIDLRLEGFAPESSRIECSLDMRYLGQSYEINIPFSPTFNADFNERHRQLYGYSDARRLSEIVNIRVNGIGITQKYSFPVTDAPPAPLPQPSTMRPAWFEGRSWNTALFRREDLLPGTEGQGPALITGGQSTVVITPRFRFRIDSVGTLVATRFTPAQYNEVAAKEAIGEEDHA
jgi:N-methylhydantoinase A/oxoprolinase/acetone carboxylase beta subunit